MGHDPPADPGSYNTTNLCTECEGLPSGCFPPDGTPVKIRARIFDSSGDERYSDGGDPAIIWTYNFDSVVGVSVFRRFWWDADLGANRRSFNYYAAPSCLLTFPNTETSGDKEGTHAVLDYGAHVDAL